MKQVTLIFIFILFQVNAQNYKDLISILNQQPDSVEKYFKIGKIFDETGNDRQAIIAYQKALKMDETNIKIKSNLAKVYKRYGQLNKAITLQEAILKQDSLNFLEQYKLAVNYAQIREFEKSLKLLYQLIKEDPQNPNYLYKIGVYETDLNRKLDAFLQAYRIDSLHKKTLYGLIKNYKVIQFIDSAEYYTKKGLQAYPNDSKFLRQTVIANYRHKQYKDMLIHLKKMDSLHYDALFVYKNTGLAYLMLNDLKNAEINLKKAIAVERTDPVNYYYLGLLYEKKNDLFNAKQYLNLSMEYKKPALDKEYFELGTIAKKERNIKEAIKYFKWAFNNNHKNKEALLQLAMMSEVYYKSPDIAIKYYRQYLDLFPNKDKEQTLFARHQLSKLKEKAFLSQ